MFKRSRAGVEGRRTGTKSHGGMETDTAVLGALCTHLPPPPAASIAINLASSTTPRSPSLSSPLEPILFLPPFSSLSFPKLQLHPPTFTTACAGVRTQRASTLTAHSQLPHRSTAHAHAHVRTPRHRRRRHEPHRASASSHAHGRGADHMHRERQRETHTTETEPEEREGLELALLCTMTRPEACVDHDDVGSLGPGCEL